MSNGLLNVVDDDPQPTSSGGDGGTFDSRLRALEQDVREIKTNLKHVATNENVQIIRTEISTLGGELKGQIKDVEKEVKALESWALSKIIMVISLVGMLITMIVGVLRYLSP
ncbi:MAG: hypothetical protein OXC18_21320 [Desulfurellaceae bacterium]|nr:hypothetical protein [Desulfurellaceae bacterium]